MKPARHEGNAPFTERARLRERDDVLERALLLPVEDMAHVYAQVGRYLEQVGHHERPADRRLRLQMEALDALRAASRHIEPDAEAPVRLTIRQYKDAQQELGLSLSVQQVIRRWGRWADAVKALRGEHVFETPEQRRRRGVAAPGVNARKRRGQQLEEPMSSVRAFLKTGLPHTVNAFNTWAKEENKKRTGDLLYPTMSVIYSDFVLSLDDIFRVADPNDELTLAQARALYREQLRAESGPLALVSSTGIALTFDETRREAAERIASGFMPPYVGQLNASRVWKWDDLDRLVAGKPIEAREEGCLQELFLNTGEMAEMLKREERSVRVALFRGSASVPPWSGRVVHDPYWLREDVLRWMDGNEDILGLEGVELMKVMKRRGARGRRRKRATEGLS